MCFPRPPAFRAGSSGPAISTHERTPRRSPCDIAADQHGCVPHPRIPAYAFRAMSTAPDGPPGTPAGVPASVPAGPGRARLLTLSLAALGVVYGDIGTSPLYAMRESLHGAHGVPPTPANVLGLLSLFAWALVIVVSIKY